MVTIRLARVGTKKKPFYNVVVTNHTSARDSGEIEKIGYYDPFSKENIGFVINQEKLENWKKNGAQCSPKVRYLLRKSKQQQ